jgi:seryl-tRNA synthetase
MTSTKPARYGHLVVAIRHCGVTLTKELFLKRVSDKTPEETDHAWTVDDFLREHKTELLKHKQINANRYKFYPRSKKKANISEWDLSTLCFLLLKFCDLSPETRQDISSLQDLRNNVIHFGGTDDISEDIYESYIERLKGITDRCTKELDNHQLKSELENVILNDQNIQEEDVEEGEEELKQWFYEEQSFQVGIAIESDGKGIEFSFSMTFINDF